MSAPLLDTNVLLRHIVADVPEQASRATALLARIEQGELSACLAHTVVFETVYTLQRFYRVPRPAIRDAVLPVIELPGIVLPGKTSYRQIFDWYVAFPALSFADCYHAMLARRLKLPAIVSFDRGYDRLPGVARIEP